MPKGPKSQRLATHPLRVLQAALVVSNKEIAEELNELSTPSLSAPRPRSPWVAPTPLQLPLANPSPSLPFLPCSTPSTTTAACKRPPLPAPLALLHPYCACCLQTPPLVRAGQLGRGHKVGASYWWGGGHKVGGSNWPDWQGSRVGLQGVTITKPC